MLSGLASLRQEDRTPNARIVSAHLSIQHQLVGRSLPALANNTILTPVSHQSSGPSLIWTSLSPKSKDNRSSET
jgi:hypothetical protein